MVIETLVPQLAPYLDWQIFENTGGQFADAIAIFIVSTAAFWLFRNIVLAAMHQLAKRTSTIYDDLVIEFIQSVKPPLYLILSLYLSGTYLNLHSTLDKGLEYAAAIGIMYYLVKGVNAIITHLKAIYVKKELKENKTTDTSFLDTLEAMAHLLVWLGAALLIFSNLGFDITALIAGLGIGGLAVAFAAQAVLGDILASFSIYFDKPFREGDFIIVGSDMGVVKHIGIKSTRIQALSGQELVMSNKELTDTRINNYKRMEKRRNVFSLGVTYGTPSKKLKKIPEWVTAIINGVKDCKADRVHFKSFGDFSLNFECVYYIDSADYNRYMDAQQEMNLKIAEKFEKEKVEFAFPTQTVYVKK